MYIVLLHASPTASLSNSEWSTNHDVTRRFALISNDYSNDYSEKCKLTN